MLKQDVLVVAPHVLAFPGLALTVTALGFNRLGEGLADSFRPPDVASYPQPAWARARNDVRGP